MKIDGKNFVNLEILYFIMYYHNIINNSNLFLERILKMKPLIEIKTIPISIEFKTNSAKFERVDSKADIKVTRDNKGLTMRSNPIKVKLDSSKSKDTFSKTTAKNSPAPSDVSKKPAFRATARFVEEGKMKLNIHFNQESTSNVAENSVAVGNIPIGNGVNLNNEFDVTFTSDYPIDPGLIPSDVSIDYEIDKMNFDFNQNQVEYKFVPASLEVEVKEYPKVIIEYIGGPIYVPPSSDPNYVPLDTKV